MQEFRILSIAAGLALIASAALAQSSVDLDKSWGGTKAAAKSAVGGSSVCVPGATVEALSEGGWYPAVVLDPLRDGRCFVHYEGYGADDDEALPPNAIRSRR
ncbi:hypothetical protein CCC_02175 [Paramagnetospirillum magnetotacticum MS-1]|uniref:Uncharacterized protein n=1 Tax=Paramagnetospirillum magnetotacticum MS-1 TaxID=272627 RepID=A0A0C2YVJ4_PARME|nr:hypothetical protein [Paramagnetospirillum magnetotacticum]KIL98725.1 hypothetical protein CCC_02175 [Paramagnetospirillum magnetotacticum MS-1]